MKKWFILFFSLIWISSLFSYFSVGTDSTLDIVTWNLQDFPKAGSATIAEVQKIVDSLGVDLIAVQEISDVNSFNSLVSGLNGWSGLLSSHTYFDGTYQKPGILFREDVVTVDSSKLLFQYNTNAFPRPPIEFLVRTAEGNHYYTFRLIVVHLKAFEEEENEQRRRQAIIDLKSYLDHEIDYSRERDFIVVGDFNDQLEDAFPDDNIFGPFLDNPEKFTFLTKPLAGNVSSYISFGAPSLIDHVLINAEVLPEYGEYGTTEVLFPDSQNPQFRDTVSDHRPVFAKFAFSNTGPLPDITPISAIHANFSQFAGQTVTLRGVITIGSGILSKTYTSAYLHDESGAGINIYKYGELLPDLERYTFVELKGTVYEYKGLHEIQYQSHKILGTDYALPEPEIITTATIANISSQGIWVKVIGTIDTMDNTPNTTITLNDGSGPGKIFIDADAGLDISEFKVGDEMEIVGVKTVYDNSGEVVPGYQSDIGRPTHVTHPSFSKLKPESPIISNYPNPFNAGTQIFLNLPVATVVEVTIFDLLGRQIKKVVNHRLSAGQHRFLWHGESDLAQQVSSGVYVLQLKTPGEIISRKIVFVK